MSGRSGAQGGRLYGPKDIAEYLGVPLATVYSWQTKGTGPKFSRIGKYVRYRLSDVDRWIDERAA